MKHKLSKTAHCGYLYADGHAVILHQSKHPQAGDVQWVEIHERIAPACNFAGRLVFHHPRHDRKFRLALEAKAIRASTPSVNNGSDNTKRLSLRVGNFSLDFQDGSHLAWIQMPDIISDGLTYQPDHYEAFRPEWQAGVDRWSGHRITQIHRHPARA